MIFELNVYSLSFHRLKFYKSFYYSQVYSSYLIQYNKELILNGIFLLDYLYDSYEEKIYPLLQYSQYQYFDLIFFFTIVISSFIFIYKE